MSIDLTKRLVDAAEARPKPYELRDAKVRGLLLRVQPSGLKAWIVERARGERRTLQQPYPITTLDAARVQAMGILSGVEPWDRVKVLPAVSLGAFLHGSYGPWAQAERKTGLATKLRILSAFPGFVGKPIAELSAWALDKWKRDRLNAGIKASTVNRDLNALRAALGKAVEWRVIGENPMAGVKAAKVLDDNRVRFLSSEEEERLLVALARRDTNKIAARCRTVVAGRAQHAKVARLSETGFADYLSPMTLLALNTGCRRGELTGLVWERVDLLGRVVTVTAATSKSSKTRHVPLNSAAVAALTRWKLQSPSGRVFPITSQKTAWAALLKAARIQEFRFHDCRHHFASKLVMAGVDLNTVRELLGHSDLKMTLRYAHLAPEHKAAAVEKLVTAQTSPVNAQGDAHQIREL